MTDATKDALLRITATQKKSLAKAKARARATLSAVKTRVIALEGENYTAAEQLAAQAAISKAQAGVIAELEAEIEACRAGLEAQLDRGCRWVRCDSLESEKLIYMMTKAGRCSLNPVEARVERY